MHGQRNIKLTFYVLLQNSAKVGQMAEDLTYKVRFKLVQRLIKVLENYAQICLFFKTARFMGESILDTNTSHSCFLCKFCSKYFSLRLSIYGFFFYLCRDGYTTRESPIGISRDIYRD